MQQDYDYAEYQGSWGEHYEIPGSSALHEAEGDDGDDILTDMETELCQTSNRAVACFEANGLSWMVRSSKKFTYWMFDGDTWVPATRDQLVNAVEIEAAAFALGSDISASQQSLKDASRWADEEGYQAFQDYKIQQQINNEVD